MPNERTVTVSMASSAALFDKADVILFRKKNNSKIKTVSITSFVNEILGVIGRQSPKHPQLVNLGEPSGLVASHAYPVRKVKKTIISNNSQLKKRICQPIITAKPAIISSAIITTASSNACS